MNHLRAQGGREQKACPSAVERAESVRKQSKKGGMVMEEEGTEMIFLHTRCRNSKTFRKVESRQGGFVLLGK